MTQEAEKKKLIETLKQRRNIMEEEYTSLLTRKQRLERELQQIYRDLKKLEM